MNKIFSWIAGASLLLSWPLFAADHHDQTSGSAAQLPAIYQHVKDDDATFAKELAQAGHLPVEQSLEVRIIHAYEQEEYTQFKTLGAELDAAAATWNISNSRLVRSATELTGLRDWVHALAALGANDTKGFEDNLKQAMWDSPHDAEFYAEVLIHQRTQEKMASLKVPLDVPIKDSNGKTTTLGQLLQGHKAVLVDFWASWCTPCMANMSHLLEQAASLPQQGVGVVAMNMENNAQTAEKVRQDLHADFPWLVEPSNTPYSSLFDIDSIPRVVLIGADGTVLFNGHPHDPGLNAALEKLGAKTA